MLQLAESNEQLMSLAIAQLATAEDVPPNAIGLLLKATKQRDAAPKMLADTIVSLAKLDHDEVPDAMLSALATLDTVQDAGGEKNRARRAFVNDQRLEALVSKFEHLSSSDVANEGIWADVALLVVASRKNASPESREMAKQAIETAW